MDLRKTVIQTVRPDQHTRVYRVTTQSSVYVLGIVEVLGRRFAVLHKSNEAVTMRDSDPRIGERSLWDVDPTEWVGRSLSVATLTTSAIRSAELDRSAESLALIGQGRSAGAARATAIVTGQRASVEPEPEAPPATYPETHVDYAEHAAGCLRAIVRRTSLFADVAHDSVLTRRLEVALADAVLSLERLALARR